MNTVIKLLSLLVLFATCQHKPSTKIDVVENLDKSSNFLLPSHLKFEKKEEVDFDNDQMKDVIITASDATATEQYEFWLKNNKVIYEFRYPWVSINYKWLENLDEDEEFEVIRAQGFEDGVDYAIFDIRNGKQIPILYFNPALRDDAYPGKFFWGYPRDIQKLIINNSKEILSSVDNIQSRSDNHIVPSSQKQLPYLLFQGTANQPEFDINNLNSFQYKSLSQLVKDSKNEILPEKKMVGHEISSFDVSGLWKASCVDAKISYLLLNNKKRSDGIMEIYDQKGDFIAKMKVEYNADDQTLKYIGTNIIGHSIDSQNIASLSTGDDIAHIKLIEENKLTITWLGLHNKSINKKMFSDNPFGKGKTAIIEKCSN